MKNWNLSSALVVSTDQQHFKSSLLWSVHPEIEDKTHTHTHCCAVRPTIKRVKEFTFVKCPPWDRRQDPHTLQCSETYHKGLSMYAYVHVRTDLPNERSSLKGMYIRIYVYAYTRAFQKGTGSQMWSARGTYLLEPNRKFVTLWICVIQDPYNIPVSIWNWKTQGLSMAGSCTCIYSCNTFSC